ncbi:MAG: NAD-dependent protein deacylase [Spirochaetales bacterium]|nr:NAD-dependent protein deacylase [Spirochaetales bacterium]
MGEFSENSEIFERKFTTLFQMVTNARSIAVFTGAGVSTMSGIPDFRGKHGVYNSPWKGMSVEEIISIDFFRRDPEIFYKWAEEVWYHLEEYRPNIVHTTLKKMEDKGFLKTGVFTQNIDFLHERAGSKKVYNLHGTALRSYCTSCRKIFKYEEVAPTVRLGQVPKCDRCGGVIKPDIVFYGESLPSDVLDLAEIAFKKADLTLILGSSLTVYPAASLPRLTNYYGGKTVIVNAQPTDQDESAALCFRDLEQVFSALDKALDTL